MDMITDFLNLTYHVIVGMDISEEVLGKYWDQQWIYELDWNFKKKTLKTCILYYNVLLNHIHNL